MRQAHEEITEIRPLLFLIPNLSRLELLLRAMHESDPFYFDMKLFAYDCATPCCVLGNYSARRDLQQAFELRQNGRTVSLYSGSQHVTHSSPEVRGHFGITLSEANELFGPAGCGGAITRGEAIQYLEQFIHDRTPLARCDHRPG